MDKNSQCYIVLRALVFIGLIGYLLYSLFLQDSKELHQQIQQEIAASKAIIPSDRWQAVIENTENTFKVLVTKYGMIERLNSVLIPTKDAKPSRGINNIAEKAMSFNYNAARNTPLLVFQSIYRWFLMLGWFWVFLPFLAALLLDGMYQWKLKRYVFGKVTVQFYRIWFRAFWLITFLSITYLLLPNLSLFNNIAQLFPPLALLVLGISLNRLWANYQKLM
ncbi:DUF4400 domain-containing protein [Photorhabdus heterorhabditis]|uniref:DUF4400 domain-containing protein n=1 Tax=Photorhabdus heterorhabditis TaxID=880156 RepID=UPI0015620E95|nr:DUF4400 domain-containing protein [Photorhabdus heterorhabditis]NRN29012.1 DUF4400 domain-containing protein [Photorhabdus heterorhabditis subsp. aluminescens]